MSLAATFPASPAAWREPGQAVSADYLRAGTLHYTAENREIVGRNGPHFNNRPLYCHQNTEGAVLAGDRPLARLIARPCVHGALSIALVRGTQAKWLHAFAEVESRYRCGRMTWRCTDSAFGGTVVTLTVLPFRGTAGLAARLHVDDPQAGDSLVWAFGGAYPDDDPRLNWDPIMRGNPDICRSGDPRKPLLGFGPQPEKARGNVAAVTHDSFTLAAAADATRITAGRFSRGRITVADGSAFPDPAAFAKSTASELPLVCGTASLGANEGDFFWAIEAVAAETPPCLSFNDPSVAFSASESYLREIETVALTTPDAYLDAAVTSVAHAIDGACEHSPAVFRHGAMAFNIRFIGWRVICGATALGWHQRVRENAAFVLATQRTSHEGRTRPSPDQLCLGTHEAADSRYYGRGYFARTGYEIYDVQSQFFDQTIRDWRAAPEPAFEAQLRTALEIHTEWLRECFDPDDDGLYESYINTLPTDSVWYDGGGSVEASAYAYSAHRAAMDLARLAGDSATEARHRAQLEKIAHTLRSQLWLPDRGHFGAYREQAGHRRVHSDAWTYSVYLPIDAGITTDDEALQSLFYTEWALERIRLPFGGKLCQPSNWVPWKWSVRDMFGGDICGLALAYFQLGLGDAGYELLRGATLESGFASVVPGGFSHIGAGTDFGDNVHMFTRAATEGLFGYEPDYPNGRVRFRPAFPEAWPSASVRTADFSLSFQRESDRDSYAITLARSAALDLRFPVRANAVRRVLVDGKPVSFEVAPGYGCTLLSLRLSSVSAATIRVELDGRTAASLVHSLSAEVGEEIVLNASQGAIVGCRDFHDVLSAPHTTSTQLRARLATKPGHHLVLLDVRCGTLPRWEICQLHVTDSRTADEHARRAPRLPAANSTWTCLDLAPHYNGDVRTIFQQNYASPRPATCSVRLGTDGYSAWTFPYWNLKPPPIDLGAVASLTDRSGRLVTPQRVPFHAFSESRNILFTSRWDNWPTLAEIPINQSADTLWLLVAGSTFPMQTRIANAEFRFCYADGVVEKLELIPPLNFWMLCPWGGEDYSYAHDAFCLPPEPPAQVQLGQNCRAMVLSWKLRPGVALEKLTLETLSADVVIGLLGVSLEHRAS